MVGGLSGCHNPTQLDAASRFQTIVKKAREGLVPTDRAEYLPTYAVNNDENTHAYDRTTHPDAKEISHRNKQII